MTFLARGVLSLLKRRTEVTISKSSKPSRAQASHGRIGFLLIVEPEPLLRWSLATYLSKWFDVFPADSRDAADRILDDHRVDAAVLSDGLPPESVRALTDHVRRQHAESKIVQTVTSVRAAPPADATTKLIEKPFELARLADMLGVGAHRPPI